MADNNTSSGSGGGYSTVVAAIIVIIIICLLGSCMGGSGSSRNSTGKEQRCWYCGKVIVNSQGRAIHKTNGKCDYCGKPN